METGNMAKGFFITGTDTGVGKTTVGTALVRAMVASGATVRALKPIESGCVYGPDGALMAADAEALRAASSFPDARLSDVARYCLIEPLAPAIAAERAGVSLDLAECVAFVRRAQAFAEWTVVEGAGGALVPFVGSERDGYVTVADFIAKLGLPALVVARSRLGTINHTLLTVNELRRRGINVIGVVLNDATNDAGLETEDNARALRALGVNILGELPHGASGEAAEATLKAIWTAVRSWRRD
jgi:dethiobiotin synthetase